MYACMHNAMHAHARGYLHDSIEEGLLLPVPSAPLCAQRSKLLLLLRRRRRRLRARGRDRRTLLAPTHVVAAGALWVAVLAAAAAAVAEAVVVARILNLVLFLVLVVVNKAGIERRGNRRDAG
jgi:hypothetical protein